MNLRKLPYLVLSITAFASAATVNAQIQGEIWSLAPLDDFDATAANLPPSGTPGVTFTINNGPLTFTSYTNPNNTGDPSANYTIGSFLASGGAFNITYGAGYNANSPIDQTIMLITGDVTVLNGQTFTVNHDDGLTLTIGGLAVVDVPGPTAPVVTTVTYTGPSGNLPFELIYAEVDGPPAVLQTDLPLASVPDGGFTATMLGTALTALAFIRRKFQA